MLVVEQVVARLNSHIKQLESLAYSGETMNAVQLVGHIEECLEISQVPNEYRERVKNAIALISAERPKPASVGGSFDIDLGALAGAGTGNSKSVVFTR